MKCVEQTCLVEAYLECAGYVVSEGKRKSDMNEVQDLFCTVALTNENFAKTEKFIEALGAEPELKYGLEKARRAYEKLEGNITKPSYIGRVVGFPFLKPGSNDLSPIDQIDLVAEKFADAPQSSNLAISVFHPSDLRDAYRPGYVPCLSFVDVKFRAGELRTKFFFRSCDFAEVAIFDFYFCSRIHFEVLRRCALKRPDIEFQKSQVSWFFSRAFTYKRKRAPITAIRKMWTDVKV